MTSIYRSTSNISGVFTVPMSGTWTVSISLATPINTSYWHSTALIYFNGERIPESAHGVYGYCYGEHYCLGVRGSAKVRSTGERKIFLKASAGDTIAIRICGEEKYEYIAYNILTCFEFHH